MNQLATATKRRESPTLTIVMPAFNEVDTLPVAIQKVVTEITGLVPHYEIVVIDDGSNDGTSNVLQKIAFDNPRIVPITLSRNFGKEAALLAGLTVARGRCVVLIDADLQHPPALIPSMIKLWRQGFDVVNATKEQRGREPLLYTPLARIFNWVMSKIIGDEMENSSDFKLIDRQVVDAILSCTERNRFFRGLVAWVGFRITSVKFTVDDRLHSRSKWSPFALLGYSITSIVAFSSFPLRLVGYVGLITALIGFVLLLQTLYNYFSGLAAVGFTTVIALQILLGGLVLIALGVMSVYLSKMYDEQKQRPIFVVRNRNGDRSAFDRSRECPNPEMSGDPDDSNL